MPWKPTFEGEVPTLGYDCIDWIESNLVAPDNPNYVPLILTDEQAQFLLNFYQLDPDTGKRVYRRGLLGRSRGWGKSPFSAAIAAVEALGPVMHAGWDAYGRPVGQPWSNLRTPIVQFAAVSEAQTKNAWDPLREMLEYNASDLGVEIMGSMVTMPRGYMQPITANARTVKGGKPVFVVLDQTEDFVPSNGGPSLAQTLRTNAAKIGGHTLETPNAYIPGTQSVAEQSRKYAEQIAEGLVQEPGLLYDMRSAPPETDIYNRDSLRQGLLYTYHDSAIERGGWVDVDRLIGEMYDPANDIQKLRADYLNQVTHASDAWLTHLEIDAVTDNEGAYEVAPGDMITLGFDGSRGRAKSKADATALVGCRVSDGHLFPLGIWEQPEGAAGEGWMVDEAMVNLAVINAFKTYNVVGFFADPEMWDGHVAMWTARFGKRLKVARTRERPITYNTNAIGQVVADLESLRSAISNEEITLAGDLHFIQHFRNARRQKRRSGFTIAKPSDDYLAKIDAVYAANLAFAARMKAVADGMTTHKRKKSVIRRLK